MERLGDNSDILVNDVVNFDNFSGYAPEEIGESGIYQEEHGDCYVVLPISEASEQYGGIRDDGSGDLVGYKIPGPYPQG